MSKVLKVDADSRFFEFNNMTLEQVAKIGERSSNAKLLVDTYPHLFDQDAEVETADESTANDSNGQVAATDGADTETVPAQAETAAADTDAGATADEGTADESTAGSADTEQVAS